MQCLVRKFLSLVRSGRIHHERHEAHDRPRNEVSVHEFDSFVCLVCFVVMYWQIDQRTTIRDYLRAGERRNAARAKVCDCTGH